eukprot:TRINITY_DN4020_c0_g1_i1.p1 TRINITY_DN4020_c0_g1~~TRINITY_DN4020_c0_g1_i1.p1  ORF type:complete len:135 (+),score=46.38 TRINITY_DN4020_c0_g1_i1:51-455(+)
MEHEPSEYSLSELHGQAQFSNVSYQMITGSTLRVHHFSQQKFSLADDINEEIRYYLDSSQPSVPFQYNFLLELETISQIHEEKVEEMERKEREKLKAQENAWRSLSEKRKSSSNDASLTQDPRLLLGLEALNLQ